MFSRNFFERLIFSHSRCVGHGHFGDFVQTSHLLVDERMFRGLSLECSIFSSVSRGGHGVFGSFFRTFDLLVSQL